MAALNPALSSSLANDVYGISKLPDLRRAVQQLKIDYNDKFVFSESCLLSARTGPPGIKISTAFGFVLAGKGINYKV